MRSGTTLPGASSKEAHISTMLPSSATRPASTRSAAISQATRGFDVDLSFELMLVGQLASGQERQSHAHASPLTNSDTRTLQYPECQSKPWVAPSACFR